MANTFEYEHPQILNLDKYGVFQEQPLNDTSYIFIDKLPNILTYWVKQLNLIYLKNILKELL